MATFKQYENSKGKFWEVRAYLGFNEETNKEARVFKKGFKTKKQASDYLKQEQYKFDNSLSLPNGRNLTVNELYHDWLNQYRIEVEKSSLNKTETMFKLHILPVLGNIQVKKVRPSVIQKLVNDLCKKMVSYRKVYNYINRFFEFAVFQGYIAVNPCNKVKVPKRKIKKEHVFAGRDCDFYTKEQLETVISSLEKHASLKWNCCFRLLAYLGLRRGEVLGLQWGDVNFSQKTVSVKRALKRKKGGLYIGATKNASSTRTLDVDSITLAILKKWKREQALIFLKFGENLISKETFIFRQKSKNFPLNDSSLRNFYHRFCKKYGLPFCNIHGFRHTHCSLLFEAGVSMKDVKARMGHNDIQTTMNVYAHVTPQSKKASAEKFAMYMGI